MSTNKFSWIVNNTIKGLWSLSFRSLIINIAQICSVLVLAKYLTSEDYGIFGVINSVLGTILFYTDIGIGTTLTQKESEPTKEELQAYFGIRLALSLSLTLLFFICFPLIANYYSLSQEVSNLKYFGIILILDVLPSMNMINLNFQMSYNNVAKVTLISALISYVVQILCAIAGFAFYSFFIAIIVRSLITLIGLLYYDRRFYLPTLNFSQFKNQYKYSFAHQLNSIIPVTKSAITPFFMKMFMGISEIGSIFWITSLVSIPKIVAYNFNQVLYPSIAKLLGSRQESIAFIDKSLGYLLLILTFLFGLGSTIGEDLIHLFFDKKWHQYAFLNYMAAQSVYSHCLAFIFLSLISSVKLPALRTKIETFFFPFELILLVVLMNFFGSVGFFGGQTLSNMAIVLISIYLVKHYLSRKILTQLLGSIIFTGASLPAINLLNLNHNLMLKTFIFLCLFGIYYLFFYSGKFFQKGMR